jgi:hypothetical protein
MNRMTVIQQIIDKINARVYLEIGVSRGKVLLRIKAPYKFGVDPKLKLSIDKKIKRRLGLLGARLFEITSDRFFNEFSHKILSNGIDVAFVDGLHTYEQTLRDVENCLRYLNKNGVIVMHDCNPLSYAIAYSVKESTKEISELIRNGEIPGWNNSWCGDVWKTLVHLRIVHSDLNIFTLDLDWGLGIITRGKDTSLDGLTIDELRNSDYLFLERNRERLLHLKPPKYLYEFLNTLQVT